MKQTIKQIKNEMTRFRNRQNPSKKDKAANKQRIKYRTAFFKHVRSESA